jgi:cardiolipin synthase A/B
MWPIWQIVVGIIALWVALQVAMVTALSLSATRRKRRQLPAGFPHPTLPEANVGANHLHIYPYGHDLYEAMLAAIDEAKECIYMESFIWKDDVIGREFKAHLTAKAEEGVAVYVIFDVFGNLVVPRAFKQFPPIIHALRFAPWQHVWRLFDPRVYALEHRKLLVVDGNVGFIGGYNIGALYATQWRDTHLRVIGPAAMDLAQSFVDFWNRFAHKRNHITKYHPRHFDPTITLRGTNAMRLVFPIREMYLDAFDRAQKHILLTNAYFIPDHTLLEALTEAAGRGVEVHVVLPWQSNHILADWGARSYFEKCLRAGVHIWGYKGVMIHAKTCTVDGIWSTIGTANLDRLSAVGNYEINIEIYSQELAQSMELLFTSDQINAFEITAGFWHKRPWYIKLSERILAPLQVMM